MGRTLPTGASLDNGLPTAHCVLAGQWLGKTEPKWLRHVLLEVINTMLGNIWISELSFLSLKAS